MMLFRNAKTGEVAVGAENKVEQCTYVAVITRLPEELDNELTGGWKVVEVRRFGHSITVSIATFLDGKKKCKGISLKVFNTQHIDLSSSNSNDHHSFTRCRKHVTHDREARSSHACLNN
jgi:hypothetical protein